MDIDAIRARWPKDLPGAHPDVDQADEDITDLLAEVDALRADVERLKAQVDELDEAAREAEKEAEALGAKVDELEATAAREGLELHTAATLLWEVAADIRQELWVEGDDPRGHAYYDRLTDILPDPDAGDTQHCSACDWRGPRSDLAQKLGGELCPSCSIVLVPRGGLRLSAVAASDPAPRPDYADLLAELGEVRVRFGLDAQGHVSTIERMLAEGASWEDIGAAIHWDPATVKRHWAARQAALAVTAGLPEDEVVVAASCGPHLHETGGIPFEEGDGLAEGWCAGCEKDLRPDGPIRQSKSYDSPYQEWACPHCGHVEDDPELSLSDLRDVMVEGWMMPEAIVGGAVAHAHLDSEGTWILFFEVSSRLVTIPWPFAEGVNVTADMLRALGFTVEAGS